MYYSKIFFYRTSNFHSSFGPIQVSRVLTHSGQRMNLGKPKVLSKICPFIQLWCFQACNQILNFMSTSTNVQSYKVKWSELWKPSSQVHVQLNQSTNLQVQAWLMNKFNFDVSHKTNKHIKTWIGVSARRTCQCSIVLQWHLKVQQDHHLESHYLKWHELVQA